MPTGAEGGRGSQIKRLCNLIEHLLTGETLDASTIATICEIGQAQAHRYLEHVAQIQGVKRTADGVRFSRSTLFPPVSRDAAVAAALMTGLAALFEGTRYHQAMREAFELVASRAVQPLVTESLIRQFKFAVRGGDPALREKASMLESLVQGVLGTRRTRVTSIRFDGSEKRQLVDPLTLLVYDHQLYLIARDPKGKVVAFRCSRISAVVLTNKVFVYPATTEYNLDAVLGDVWGIFIDYDEQPLTDIVLQFSDKWRSFAKTHRWHPSQRSLPNGKVCFHLRPCPEFKQWLLGFGAEVEVLEPGWLRSWVADQALALTALYGASPDLDGGRAGNRNEHPANGRCTTV